MYMEYCPADICQLECEKNTERGNPSRAGPHLRDARNGVAHLPAYSEPFGADRAAGEWRARPAQPRLERDVPPEQHDCRAPRAVLWNSHDV